MATVAILQQIMTESAAGRARATPKHPQVKIKAESLTMTLPYGPRGTSIEGLAAPWSVIDRPGRKPLVVRDGNGLLALSFTVLIGHRNHQSTITGYLSVLRRLARSGERITLLNMHPMERGPWRLVDVSIDGEQRQHGTNHITRAAVSLSFLEAVDANPKLGPIQGGKKGGKKKKLPATHVVKKGDTLRKLANRYYGEPGKWRLIAKANNVKRPNKPKVGRKLRIPKEK